MDQGYDVQTQTMASFIIYIILNILYMLVIPRGTAVLLARLLKLIP